MERRSNRFADYVRLSAERASQGHLPVIRQLAEMALLQAAHGLGPGYYHLAGMWRRKMSWSDKWSHLGGRAYTRRLATLNPVAYRKLSQHKLAEKALLERLGLPTAEFAGYCRRGKGRCRDGSRLENGADFARLLRRTGWGRICVKRIEGWSGKGFRVLDVARPDAGGVRELGACDWTAPAAYWEREIGPELDQGVLLEAYIDQHADYARFNPSSVNTLRLWVRRAPSGRARTMLGYLRVGRAGSVVDNQSAGGIVVPIDLETGELRKGLCGTARRSEFAVHPDHGAPIEGVVLTNVSDALELATSTLEVFPGLDFAGMDVAMTPAGPVIVELNSAPDREGSAFVDVPSRRALFP